MKLPTELETGQIIDSLGDGLFIIDTNYTILAINRAALDILKVEEDEALGRKCFEVFHASVCEGACPMRRSFENETTERCDTLYIINAEGDRVPLSVTTSVLRDRSGKITAGVEIFRDISLIQNLRKEIQHSYTFEDIVGKSKRMQELFSILPDIAQSGSTVLLQGESGTGKELFARAIHNLSERYEEPFVVVNAGAIPEQLLESELFGYVKGAFTGAVKNRAGRIEAARGGTLFLDEIGDIPLSVQVKLLRFIQFKEYQVLGSDEVHTADVRIISASNKNLRVHALEGTFREDLYYRLSVITLQLPPLRQRKEDIPLLIERFIVHFNSIRERSLGGVSQEVMAQLMEYDYPGNVRELQNIIEYAFALCRSGLIERTHLPEDFRSKEADSSRTLAQVERNHIEAVLARHKGNRKKTAEELEIDPSTLWRKMKEWE